MKAKSSRNSFTLVELLVTITIIGVLVSLGIVGFQKAIASAQRTKAASGLRQLGLATQNYVADNNGFLPGPTYYGVPVSYNTNDSRLLTTMLLPYTAITPKSGNQVLSFLEFPAEKKIRQKFPGQRPPVWVTQYQAVDSSGQIVDPLGHLGTGFTNQPQKFAKLDKVSATWYLRDVDMQSTNTGAVDRNMQSPTPWHGDVRLHLYFDGRVEARPRSESDAAR